MEVSEMVTEAVVPPESCKPCRACWFARGDNCIISAPSVGIFGYRHKIHTEGMSAYRLYLRSSGLSRSGRLPESPCHDGLKLDAGADTPRQTVHLEEDSTGEARRLSSLNTTPEAQTNYRELGAFVCQQRLKASVGRASARMLPALVDTLLRLLARICACSVLRSEHSSAGSGKANQAVCTCCLNMLSSKQNVFARRGNDRARRMKESNIASFQAGH